MVGRVLAFLGIGCAVLLVCVWLIVGALALAAGPLCVECMQSWGPPVAIGLVGPVLAVAIWAIALIAAWRRPLLLLWSLLAWPVLLYSSVFAGQGFVVLLS
jgi:hypothetical protein